VAVGLGRADVASTEGIASTPIPDLYRAATGACQLATLPLLLAGLSLHGYLAGGLQWFALAVVLSIAVALLNAWVLLVEILR
jgi:hypothetical protein